MSRISRKATKAKKPWWQSTPFLACVAAVAISLFLQWEPVAEYVDIYLGTATSSLGQRSLQSKGYTNSLGISMQEAADERCELPLSNCRDAPASIHESFEITLINHSPYRVDVHWDDGRFGRVIANCEGNGAQIPLSVFRDNTFFITRHGVKEGLFDPATDLQHRFTTNKVGQTFVIPASAIPSNNPCQDRFAKACAEYARNGQCWGAPGWMIVHCCKSCDKELNASKLIDSSVRCTKENMNISTTGGVWEPGDLNRLFTSWATDEQFEQYSPNILSSPDGLNGAAVGPWVMTFDTFFGAEEADALIKGGELVGYDRSTNQGAINALGEMEMVTSTTRTSSNAWCRGPCEELPGVQAMTSRIEQVTGIPRKNYEPFQILEYQDNQFYKSHHVSFISVIILCIQLTIAG